MERQDLKFVIVGHVDHGKSTLIGRLLFDTNSLPPEKMEEIKRISADLGRETEFAFLMDHLQEEREQGITIDTAQTFFKTERRNYVIIDAPGHVEFVKNMITGASQAEAALLIVDAKEGIKEQTRRHSYILSLLGLKQVIVVLNKMDAAGYQREVFSRVKTEAEKFLDSINIKANYYIPVSALKGDNVVKKSENMAWYGGPTVLEALDLLQDLDERREEILIFPVQDVYKINEKRIVAGRIEGGELKKGQEIKVLPGGKTTKVKTIEKFYRQLEKAGIGENIGLTTEDPLFIERGNVICAPGGEPALTDTLKANVFWLGKDDLNKEEPITLRCVTQEVKAEVKEIKKRINSSTLEVLEENAQVLCNLEVGEVVIKTKSPVAVKKFNETPAIGKFVLVKAENTVAGGIVV